MVGKSSTGTTIASYVYTYTKPGASTTDTALRQTMTQSGAIASAAITYGYDAQNRLTSAVTSGGGTLDYIYDAAGNRCSTTTNCISPTYIYNAGNQLTTSPLGSYTYALSGALKSSPALSTLDYTSGGQTATITPSGHPTETLKYGDVNQAALTQDGTFHLYAGPLGTAVSVNGGVKTYYVLDPEGNVLGEQIGTNHYYYLKDANGSVTAVINSSGSTTENSYVYNPFGNLTSHSVTVSNNYGFDGGWTDSYSGLTHFGNRWYDNTIARWTQPDPNGGYGYNPATLSNTGGNGYVYVGDSPINNLDPTGRAWCSFLPVGCGTISSVTSCIGGYFSGIYSSASQALVTSGGVAGGVGGSVIVYAGEALAGAIAGYGLLGLGAGLAGAGIYEGVTNGC